MSHSNWKVVLVTLAMATVTDLTAQNTRARWRLDEGSGQLAADSGRHHFDGTLGPTTNIEASDPTWIAGRFGSALHFAGGQRVQVASNAILEPSNVTVEAWVRGSSSPGSFRYVVSKSGIGSGFASYAIYSGSGGGLTFYVAQTGGLFVLAPGVSPAVVWNGAWHHVAGSFDGARVRFYFDGVLIGTGTAATSPINYALATNTFLIGDYGGAPGFSFTGDIDEVRFWGRALSAAEVALRAQGLEVDTTAPVVAITAPSTPTPPFIVAAESIDVSATVVEATESQVSSSPALLDLLLPEGGGSIGPATFGLIEGPNTIAITATDEAGNVGADTIVVVRDTTAPTVDVVSPAEGATVGSTDIELVVRVTDANSTHAAFGANDIAVAAGIDQVATGSVLLTEGPHDIDVTVTDAAGNATVVRRHVVVDLTVPVVTILSPANGDAFGAAAALLPVTVRVDDLSTTQLDSEPAGITGSLPPGGGIAAGAVPLVEGLNTIVVHAGDGVNAAGSAQVTVRLDTIAPAVELVSPSDGGALRGTIDVEAIADDVGSGVAEVAFVLDGASVPIAVVAVAPYQTQLDTTGLAPGLHSLVAVATDQVGNASASPPSSFLVDNAAPQILFLSPAAGATVGGTVSFEVRIDDAGSGVVSGTFAIADAAPAPIDPSFANAAPTPMVWVTAVHDTTARADGPLVLSVQAVDAAGNTAVAELAVAVHNQTPPSCDLTPVSGTVVRGIVPITAAVTGDAFTDIELQVDGVSIGHSSATPFTLPFDTRTRLDGAMRIDAIVTWGAANTIISTSRVTVDNMTFALKPETLNVSARREHEVEDTAVMARLTGPNLALLLPTEAHHIVLRVVGGGTVPSVSGWAGDDRVSGQQLNVRFERRLLVNALLPVLQTVSTCRRSSVEIELWAEATATEPGYRIGSDTMRIERGDDR